MFVLSAAEGDLNCNSLIHGSVKRSSVRLSVTAGGGYNQKWPIELTQGDFD